MSLVRKKFFKKFFSNVFSKKKKKKKKNYMILKYSFFCKEEIHNRNSQKKFYDEYLAAISNYFLIAFLLL